MNSYPLTDAHCHLDFSVFDHDRTNVLLRAKENNINDIIIPGTQKIYWPRISELCKENHQLHPCYGLHPYWANEHDSDDLEQLKIFIKDFQPVALGECGLDFRPQQADKKLQMYFFEAQLDIAAKHDLPVVIHSVRATETVIQIIKSLQPLKGMIHSYSGSLAQAEQLIELGFYISLSGSVTYDNAKKSGNVAKNIPLTSLLLETDAPDQPDQKNIGKRNEPAYLVNTLEVVSGLRNVSPETVAQQTTLNARKLFKLQETS